MERPEHQTAIYKKAQEILTLVKSLTYFIKESEFKIADDFDMGTVMDKLSEMEENAEEIPILISEASVSTMPYDFRMENAVFVKSSSMELIECILCIEEMGLTNDDYFGILFDEIEELRLLFRDWIKTFDLWKYDCEDWGLFEPEGIRLVESMDEDEDDFGTFEDDDEEED